MVIGIRSTECVETSRGIPGFRGTQFGNHFSMAFTLELSDSYPSRSGGWGQPLTQGSNLFTWSSTGVHSEWPQIRQLKVF